MTLKNNLVLSILRKQTAFLTSCALMNLEVSPAIFTVDNTQHAPDIMLHPAPSQYITNWQRSHRLVQKQHPRQISCTTVALSAYFTKLTVCGTYIYYFNSNLVKNLFLTGFESHVAMGIEQLHVPSCDPPKLVEKKHLNVMSSSKRTFLFNLSHGSLMVI